MKKKYALVITTNKGFQPTHEELIEAIHTAIDKKFHATSPSGIPRKGSIKIEIGDDFSK